MIAKSTQGLAAFVSGLADPWRALAFLVARPGLWPFAALPFLLCVAIYALAAWLGWHFMGGWLDGALLGADSWWRRALGVVVAFLFWALLLLVMALLYIPAATLLSNPFNDMLSERTERLYRGVDEGAPFSFASFWKALRVGLAGEIRRSLMLAFLLALAFCLNIVPVIGQVAATAASSAVAIAFLSLEFTSFSMDRRLYTWDRKKAFLRRNRARTLGFGAMAFLILMTPIANALFIPVSAIAGTLLYCDTELAHPPPPLPGDDWPPPLPNGDAPANPPTPASPRRRE